jgi:hypothetical protein
MLYFAAFAMIGTTGRGAYNFTSAAVSIRRRWPRRIAGTAPLAAQARAVELETSAFAAATSTRSNPGALVIFTSRRLPWQLGENVLPARL